MRGLHDFERKTGWTGHTLGRKWQQKEGRTWKNQSWTTTKRDAEWYYWWRRTIDEIGQSLYTREPVLNLLQSRLPKKRRRWWWWWWQEDESCEDVYSPIWTWSMVFLLTALTRCSISLSASVKPSRFLPIKLTMSNLRPLLSRYKMTYDNKNGGKLTGMKIAEIENAAQYELENVGVIFSIPRFVLNVFSTFYFYRHILRVPHFL